ncbi:MAG: family 43 glycosylhydrolase [Oscillospiraceae bacterium]|nr:family 43 glycosylhydrolase [Oscillospiraceae bacterium]
MKNSEINIRDPFVLTQDGKYYLYGTRAKNFGQATGGFDVYEGTDLMNWSEPKQVFYSEKFGLNKSANWAPEIHKYNGKYYIFATFEQKNGMRGTFALKSDSPVGEFIPVSDKALTPEDWWSLDGTLYVDKNGDPYLVFCHEHVQILNGTVCFVKLKKDLSEPDGGCNHMFSGSDAFGVIKQENSRYVTDGPFLYRGKNNRLYLMWSTIINHSYYQCIAVSDNGEIDGNWIQLEPIFTKDGGHGMIFRDNSQKLMLTLHCPNSQLEEKPVFFELEDTGETLKIKV